MLREHRVAVERFASSALIALPITAALILLMTRLILPGEQDRIVTRMIQRIEFERSKARRDPVVAPTIKGPTPIEVQPPPFVRGTAVANSARAQNQESNLVDPSAAVRPAPAFDWRNAIEKLTRASDEEALNRWLLEQGHDRYASIMQGPVPITNSVQTSLPPTQDDATGYVNSYGDMEYKSSANCTTRMQVATRLDISDFAKHMPMVVTCKSPKKKYDLDRTGRE